MFWEAYVFASLSRCRRRGTRGWRMEDAGWCSGQFLTLTRHRSLSPFPVPTCPVNFSTHPASGDHGENLPFSLIRAHYDTGLRARGDPQFKPKPRFIPLLFLHPFQVGRGESGSWSQAALWILNSVCLTQMGSQEASSEQSPAAIRCFRLRRRKRMERTERKWGCQVLDVNATWLNPCSPKRSRKRACL